MHKEHDQQRHDQENRAVDAEKEFSVEDTLCADRKRTQYVVGVVLVFRGKRNRAPAQGVDDGRCQNE
jgi:hypothetical protein